MMRARACDRCPHGVKTSVKAHVNLCTFFLLISNTMGFFWGTFISPCLYTFPLVYLAAIKNTNMHLYALNLLGLFLLWCYLFNPHFRKVLLYSCKCSTFYCFHCVRSTCCSYPIVANHRKPIQWVRAVRFTQLCLYTLPPPPPPLPPTPCSISRCQ